MPELTSGPAKTILCSKSGDSFVKGDRDMEFCENHMHIFMNGVDYRQAVADMKNGRMQEIVRNNLEAYREKGITWVRDGGDHYEASVYARSIAPEYGIIYRTPCFAIHKKGHYGGIVGLAFEDMREYHGLVKEAIVRKADFIKIMISGIMDFSGDGSVSEESLENEEIREMIHIAHEEGMAVMAHANGARAVKAAVSAGVDSLEHGNFMDEECICMLAESDTVYVPTVSTIRNLIGDSRFPEKTTRSLWERQRQIISLCYTQGVHLALGSDAGAYRVRHGQGIIDEYDAFCEAVGDTALLRARLREGQKIICEKF